MFYIRRNRKWKDNTFKSNRKLDTFDEGKIIVDGIDISKLSETEANVYRSREIGFIFQEYNLIEEFDVYDNIALSYELKERKLMI